MLFRNCLKSFKIKPNLERKGKGKYLRLKSSDLRSYVKSGPLERARRAVY